VFVEEQQTAEGLRLGTCCDAALDGQVGQERLNFARGHLFRMAFSMMQNEAAEENGRTPARFDTSNVWFAE
jgi:hypothetical protein